MTALYCRVYNLLKAMHGTIKSCILNFLILMVVRMLFVFLVSYSNKSRIENQ